MLNPRRVIAALKQNIGKVIVGKDEVIELALIAMLCKGHVLIEDVPGTGKTTMVSSIAKSLDCSFNRIQFTPDVVPSDVTGFTMVNFKTGELEFHAGAVMCQIVLADEINRTSPKTQSSLLEIMEEYQVTVDGVTHPLPKPFMVLATQNPGEFVGTYPLPEAQMDRFFLRISKGYPTMEAEKAVLERFSGTVKPQQNLKPVCTAEDVVEMQNMIGTVYCSKEVRHYIANIAAMTRTHPSLQLGVSTRGAIALIRGAQACALLNDRDYILPEDVQRMALPVLAHRILPNPEAKMKGITAERILVAVMENVPVPIRLS
ncbi:MAG: MoxR family ATPase [Candidatus Limiplasma sp.]|nr:MoxR family ATPase [Candidatus Limiplasma sp.]